MSDLTQALIRVDELKADVSRLHGECDYLEAQLTIAMGALEDAKVAAEYAMACHVSPAERIRCLDTVNSVGVALAKIKEGTGGE